jgi:hypothetical protein
MTARVERECSWQDPHVSDVNRGSSLTLETRRGSSRMWKGQSRMLGLHDRALMVSCSPGMTERVFPNSFLLFRTPIIQAYRKVRGKFPVTALSLTRPAVARNFLYAHRLNRTHFFVGARIASVFGASVHRVHPKLLNLGTHPLGVAHQSSLRSPWTTMSFSISPFREAGSLINRPVTFAP